jgi:DNA-directed RNA polymerase specialized sigma24 family protein
MKLTSEQQDLAATFYGIAVTTANRYRGNGQDIEDMMSACLEAVCRAVVDYDPARANTKALKSYVMDRCRWACFRVIQKVNRRPPMVAESTVPPAIYDRPAPSLTEHVQELPAYRNAPTRRREVIDTYLSLGDYRKTARKLGLSYQRVGQHVASFIQSAKADLAGVNSCHLSR